MRSLPAFAKVPLAPGEQATVRFHVRTDRLAFTGLDGRRIVEPGEFQLQVGSSSLDTPVRETIRLVGEGRDATVLLHHAVPVSVEREWRQGQQREAAPQCRTVAPLLFSG